MIELTRRQTQFLVLAGNGMTKSEIASKCDVSHSTVKTTLGNARERLGSRTVGQAVIKAVAFEILALDREGRVSPS